VRRDQRRGDRHRHEEEHDDRRDDGQSVRPELAQASGQRRLGRAWSLFDAFRRDQSRILGFSTV
jgi:hypothetical protein